MKNQMPLPRRALIDKPQRCLTHQVAVADLTASLWLPGSPDWAENHQNSRLFTHLRTSVEQPLRGAAREFISPENQRGVTEPSFLANVLSRRVARKQSPPGFAAGGCLYSAMLIYFTSPTDQNRVSPELSATPSLSVTTQPVPATSMAKPSTFSAV